MDITPILGRGGARGRHDAARGTGANLRNDLVPAAAVFERIERQRPGDDDAAAVIVEGAARIDVDEAPPVEAAALVADGE